MANIKEIKKRIVSVKKTRKMTQAMKMVAAAKFKRASQVYRQSNAYEQTLATILKQVCAQVDRNEVPYYFQENAGQKEVIIIMAGDRGLCGGFNTAVFKAAEPLVQSTHQPDLHLIGQKTESYFRNLMNRGRGGFQIAGSHPNFSEKHSLSEAHKIINPIVEAFRAGQISKVTLIYNQLVNALQSRIQVQTLLPLVPELDSSENAGACFFEPSQTGLASQLVKHVLSFQIYAASLSSAAGVQGARMAAMDSASNNARDMISDLTLLFNQTRQAAITTELTEIVAGAAATT